MVGAILTQNTAWSNVKKAIVNLQQADALNAERILSLADNEVAELVRPSGYFNLKMRRLKNYCDWFQQAGGEDNLSRLSTQKLRDALLAVNGIWVSSPV